MFEEPGIVSENACDRQYSRQDDAGDRGSLLFGAKTGRPVPLWTPVVVRHYDLLW